jgi:protein-S-isoprenylcysteine O-methyltransferase Ste14
LSEEAKVAYLQEKIKAAKRKQWSADVIIGCGIFLGALGLIFPLLRPNIIETSHRILLTILGVIFVVVGTIAYESARRQYYDALGKLKERARIQV